MQREELNVGDGERVLSVITGSALLAYALKRRSIGGLVLGGIGGALLWRGATGKCPVYDSLGYSTAQNEQERQVSVPYGDGTRVDKSITVNATPEELYRFWRNFENLPRFMENLESVRVIDAKRSIWRAKGPANIGAEWEAEIINEIPNELIGWRSVDGSRVRNAGSVRFKPTPLGTEVKVEILYDPPAGIIGAMVARIFGEDPSMQVQEDLRRFKMLVEMRP